MAKIIATIYTTKYIGSQEIAHAFFEILKEANLLPDKIGLYEPIKTGFTLDKAVEFWTLQEDGCYEEGKGYVGKYGSMMGKKTKPSFLFTMTWFLCPKDNLNYITFFVSPTVYKKHMESIEKVFNETFVLVEGIYGNITHEDPKERQHVAGSLETRMPGIFWCNYFGKKYIDFFGENQIRSAPWYKVEKIEDKVSIGYLDESPMSQPILENDIIANKIKVHLGLDSFGDLEEEKRNEARGNYDVYQVKNVPKLFDS